MGARFYVGLAPWLVFVMVDRAGGQGTGWAALLALVTALAVVVWPSDMKSFSLLNGGAMAVFGALATAGVIFGGGGQLQRFGRVYAASGLTLIAVASLITVPFVERYTKELVRSKQAASPRFRRANVAVTGIWAGAFGGIAASYLLAALIRTRLAATLFNWIVPGVLVVLAVTKASRRWEDDFDPDEVTGGLDSFTDTLGAVMWPERTISSSGPTPTRSAGGRADEERRFKLL